MIFLMTLLLVHLRVLAIRRLRVTVVVTTGTVVRIAVWGSILRHAFRKTWALRAVLGSGCIARSSRLITDGRELWMLWRLTRHTDRLSHLAVYRRLTRSTTLMYALLHIGAVALFISLARCLLLLLLGFPFFAYLFEFYSDRVSPV